MTPHPTNEQQAQVRQLAQRNDWKPRNCVWELTLACNLRCKHCGSKAGKARERELTTDESLGIVDQLASAGCELVTLSGGEPTLRPDWHVIAEAAVRRGMAVNMVTNGVNPFSSPDEIVARARAAGMCNVGISIDGQEHEHDAIRGRGRHASALAFARACVRGGLPVAFMTTVNRLNLPHLAEIHRLAVETGVGMWRLQLAKPMGNLALDDSLVLSPRDLLVLLPTLADLARTSPIEVRVGDSIGYYGDCDKVLRGKGWRGGRAESWQGCQAGMQAIGIQSDGTIKGCLSLQAKVGDVDPFVEGSLRETSLEELWLRPGAFAYNRSYSADQLTGSCRRCEHARRCRGGARCVSSAFLGLVTEDPYCYHRVSRLEEDARRRAKSIRVPAATAIAFALGAAGCGGTERTGEPLADASLDADASRSHDAQTGSDTAATGDGQPRTDTRSDDDAQSTRDASQTMDIRADTIDCSQVCCSCEYGIIPAEIGAACCPDAAGLPDTGTVDTAPPDTQPDAIDCSSICCMCDYGIIPPGAWSACCAAPPPPADAKPDGDECANVCCDCEYGVIPPAKCCPP